MKSFMMMGVLALLVIAGCTSVPSGVDTANAATPSIFTEDLSCGESFATPNWASKYKFSFEIMDKTRKGQGYKVKTLANVNGRMIHLDCARNLPSRDAAVAWLVDHGYWLGSDGPEPGGASGNHRTVDRGPLYKVPDYLYK